MLALVHWFCALVILAEALNKAERTAPLRAELSRRQRATEWLKAMAWLLLALGAAGGLVAPLLGMPPPTVREVCIGAGFAVLIVRTRVKEG